MSTLRKFSSPGIRTVFLSDEPVPLPNTPTVIGKQAASTGDFVLLANEHTGLREYGRVLGRIAEHAPGDTGESCIGMLFIVALTPGLAQGFFRWADRHEVVLCVDAAEVADQLQRFLTAPVEALSEFVQKGCHITDLPQVQPEANARTSPPMTLANQWKASHDMLDVIRREAAGEFDDGRLAGRMDPSWPGELFKTHELLRRIRKERDAAFKLIDAIRAQLRSQLHQIEDDASKLRHIDGRH